MTESEIVLIIRRVLKKIAPDKEPDQLQPGDDIRRTLGIDSFDALQVVVALDEEFGIETPEEDYGKIGTLHDMAVYIAKKKNWN